MNCCNLLKQHNPMIKLTMSIQNFGEQSNCKCGRNSKQTRIRSKALECEDLLQSYKTNAELLAILLPTYDTLGYSVNLNIFIEKPLL